MLAARLPRSWSFALDQLRRDVTMVGRRIGGEKVSPLVRVRDRDAAPSTPKPGAARDLLVARVIRETEDAVTVVLRDPASAAFRFLPGQFFTVTRGGVSRNYSASNVPGGEELHLTIKKKDGGRLSPVLCRAEAGTLLRVAGPYGSFTVEGLFSSPPEQQRRLVLIAGGVGITPLMSIARTVLALETGSEVALLYGNRSAADVVFASEIDALAQACGDRLHVRHVLETAEGRLDRATTARLFAQLPASFAGADVYVCGPDGMMTEVLAALASLGVSESRIKTERFVVASRLSAPGSDGVRTVAIHVGGRQHRAVALSGATLLDAGLAAGAPMPFSCSVGGCGACRVRLLDGSVTMEEPNCLSSAEREAGWVLACVGRPGAGDCSVRIEEER